MTKPSFPMPTSSRVSNSGSQEGEKKAGYANYEVEPGFTIRLRQNFNPAMDPKKLKRIVSSRVAAQKSRWKKLQYVNYLVKRARELQWRVSALRSRAEMLSEQKRRAEREKMELEKCLSAWNQHLIFQKGQIEARRAEIESLKKQFNLLN